MSKKCTRIMALMLSMLMLVALLAACGPGTDDPSGKNGSNNGPDGSENNGSDNKEIEYVYTAAYNKLKTDNLSYINQVAYGNGKIYMLASEKGDAITYYYDEEWNQVTDEEAIANGDYVESYESYEEFPVLYSVDVNGENLAKLENFKMPESPEGVEGSTYVNRMVVDGDGNLWLAIEFYYYHYDEEGAYYDDGNGYIIQKLDQTGAEAANIDLSSFTEGMEYFYINQIAVDNDGDLYFTGGDENSIYVVNAAGELICEVKVENWVNNLIRLKDGRVGAMAYFGEDGYALRAVDKVGKKFGDEYAIPPNVYNFIDGGGDYDYYYTSSTSLSGYNMDTGKTELILNWIDSDINPNELRNIIPLEDGRIVAINYNWRSGTETYELITMTKTDASTIKEKIILNYACMWVSYDVLNKIIEFNKTNDTYRVRVTDYSDFNTEEDYSAGQTKLTTEIISGKVPDIIATNNLPISRYAAKGLLEDLTPYIEADPELGLDSIVDGVLQALQIDGKIYQAASSFTIQTLLGPAGIVGNEMGWTVEEFEQILNTLPAEMAPFSNMTRGYMLQLFCSMNQAMFVDWVTGKCDFNNPAFIKMLELAKRFPAEIDYELEYEEREYRSEYEKIMNGELLLVEPYLSSFDGTQVYKALFKDNITFIGYPAQGGSGSLASFNDGLAMSATCANKEGVWEFIRYLFTEEYQAGDGTYYMWGFPTNKNAFEKRLAETLAQYEEEGSSGGGNSGGAVTYDTAMPIGRSSVWIGDGIEIEVGGPTEEDIAQIRALIGNMGATLDFDQSIYTIIADEANAFFDGQKTAQDVAAIIQSRVTIYVNEQM